MLQILNIRNSVLGDANEVTDPVKIVFFSSLNIHDDFINIVSYLKAALTHRVLG